MDGVELDRNMNKVGDVRRELKKQIFVAENKKLSEELTKINKYTKRKTYFDYIKTTMAHFI